MTFIIKVHTWRKPEQGGKLLVQVPHYLPRAPSFHRHRASVLVWSVKADKVKKEDASICEMATRREQCPTKRRLVEAVNASKRSSEVEADHPARALSDVWDEASVEQTDRGEILMFHE